MLTSDELTALVVAYFQDQLKVPIIFYLSQLKIKLSQTDRLKYLTSIIKTTLNTLSWQERLAAIRNIGSVISQAKSSDNNDIKHRLLLFKQNVGDGKNWKDSLLGLNSKTDQNLRQKDTQILASKDIADVYALGDPSRYKTFSGRGSYTKMGTTFLTNEKQFNEYHGGGFLLDTVNSAITYDEQDEPNGIIIAIGDGAGGHIFPEDDSNIVRATHFATKAGVRILGMFDECERLIEQLKNGHIVKAVKEEVSNKLPQFVEVGSTLLCARGFKLVNNSIRLVGFAIGDSMLAYFDPTTKSINTIVPAVVAVNEMSRMTHTAIFPFHFTERDVRLFDITLPAQSILLAMTDGVWENLPHLEISGEYENGLDLISSSLDPKATMENLTPRSKNNPNPQSLVESLFQSAIESLKQEQGRAILADKPTRMGDDATLSALQVI